MKLRLIFYDTSLTQSREGAKLDIVVLSASLHRIGIRTKLLFLRVLCVLRSSNLSYLGMGIE